MGVDSKRFSLLKTVTAYVFRLCWAHPLIYVLVCSCGLTGLVFPNVFQCLLSFILLCISTYLFLAAFVSAQPPISQSLEAEPEKSAETHEGEGNGDGHIEKFYVINWEGETQIADCHENAETSVQEAYETSSGNPSDVMILENGEEKESIPVDERKLPLGLGPEDDEEEGNDRKHGFLSSEEATGGDDVRLENFFSGWKTQFESSSDSLSEASSLGDLGHLLDNLDPLLLTDEEEDEADDPSASTEAQEDEDDRPAIWAAEDEGQFDLVQHHQSSDSESVFSEDDNLIEIEILKNQVLEDDKKEMPDQRNYLGKEEPNLIDLDYSEDEKLQGENPTNYLWEEGGGSANFPEEENLIEIDLSADTVVVPLPGEEDKVSPIHICAEKKVPSVDLLIHEIHNGWVPKNTLPCVPPATVVDLIDLSSPSFLEMNMAASENEQSKPEKTESIHISITKKIQDHYITNLLD